MGAERGARLSVGFVNENSREYANRFLSTLKKMWQRL